MEADFLKFLNTIEKKSISASFCPASILVEPPQAQEYKT